MKKLLCVLVVIALTAPLSAGDLTITASDAGSGQLQIGYTVTSGTDVPVGISFVVSCDSGAEVSAVVSYDSDNFNCLPDEASDDPCSYVMGPGNPRAMTDGAGSQSDPCTSVSICMGALYADPCAAPGTVSNLITLQLVDTGSAGSCDVTISADTLRAEVQGADDFNVTYPGPTTVLFDCFPAGYTTYADWVTLGKPGCWCSAYQCDGDADGATSGVPFYYRIYTGDLGLVISNWKRKITATDLNPCADIDHKSSGVPFYYRVYTADLGKIITNWKKKDTALPGDCPRPE